jgi:RNA-directed DNA polymerase
MTAKLKSIRAELRRRLHDPIEQTGNWLKQVVRGYFNYHAVPGNQPRLYRFRRETARHWLFALRRRSQRSPWTWERLAILCNQYLPAVRVLRPYPLERFCAKHLR